MSSGEFFLRNSKKMPWVWLCLPLPTPISSFWEIWCWGKYMFGNRVLGNNPFSKIEFWGTTHFQKSRLGNNPFSKIEILENSYKNTEHVELGARHYGNRCGIARPVDWADKKWVVEWPKVPKCWTSISKKLYSSCHMLGPLWDQFISSFDMFNALPTLWQEFKCTCARTFCSSSVSGVKTLRSFSVAGVKTLRSFSGAGAKTLRYF